MDIPQHTLERFNARIDRSGDCHLWTGHRTHANGYGVIGHRGKNWLTHRFAWTIANGEIPRGLCVLHSCDNPPCVRMEHLRLGTQRENLADARMRGRLKPSRSKVNGKAILSDDDAAMIRAEYRWRGYPNGRDLAERYKVSEALIYMILKGTRRTLPEPKKRLTIRDFYRDFSRSD